MTRLNQRGVYIGSDIGGTYVMPPSKLAWGVKWHQPSALPRRPSTAAARSPGPVYYPVRRLYGDGPAGRGSEYTLRPSHRCLIEEKKTQTDKMPGPKCAFPAFEAATQARSRRACFRSA